MGVIVQIEDFESGPNSIASNSYQDNELQSYIDLHEKPYLCRILGIELAEELLAYYTASFLPNDPLLDAIIAPLVIEWKRQIRSSNGIKSILKGFIRAEYVKSLQLTQSTTGVAVVKSENSNAVQESYFVGYNEMIVESEAVQVYCRTNRVDYPTFKGQKLVTINPLW